MAHFLVSQIDSVTLVLVVKGRSNRLIAGVSARSQGFGKVAKQIGVAAKTQVGVHTHSAIVRGPIQVEARGGSLTTHGDAT